MNNTNTCRCMNQHSEYRFLHLSFTLVGAKAKKGGKKSTHPPTHEMVSNALETLKNRKGHTLVAIQKYIKEAFDCQLSSGIKSNIKKFLAQEFEAGHIKMANDDSADIKFNKRFLLAK